MSRDTNSWYKTIVDYLKEHPVVAARGAVKERGRIARLIVHVELGLSLLLRVAPTESATEVRHLLSGYRFPAIRNHWLTCRIARHYLLEYKGSNWEYSLDEYIREIPPLLKAFDLADATHIPIPSQINHSRHQHYSAVLNTPPRVKQKQVKLARSGRWLAEIKKGQEPIVINLPQNILSLPQQPTVRFVGTRTESNPSYTFSWKSLLLSAKEMDRRLRRFGIDLKYYERFQDIVLYVYNQSLNDFTESDSFTLDELEHIVGLLNVGKSTFIDVIIFNLASRGRNAKRCALIVSDVVSAVKKASLFKHLLKIPAAPILGEKRGEQLEKISKSILQSVGEGVEQGAKHPVREWFNESCPLLAHVTSDNTWNFGEEPCHKLYQKNQNASKKSNVDSTCPYYYTCPRHQIERDIAQGLVWVLTPESFVHTPVPRSVCLDDIRFAEMVARECDFLFADEADLIKGRLNNQFAPEASLVEKDSLINLTGLELSKLNNSHRPQTKSKSWNKFTTYYHSIELAIAPLYKQLNDNPLLVKWLGQITFHSYGIFAKILQEIFTELGVTDKDLFRELFDEFKSFIDDPLNRHKGSELANIARDLILPTEVNASVLADLRLWCLNWLTQKRLNYPTANLDELVKKFKFGILLAILSHHLQKLVDHQSEYSELPGFRNNALALILRPPQEYLAMIPESPVGNLLGFLYYPKKQGGGILKYFRYLGIGQSLLLNFDKLLEIDGWDSAHTVLVSGTSYAPGSSAYHIPIRPSLLLKSRSSTDPILEGKFVFSPQLNERSKHINISGVSVRNTETVYREMGKAITGEYPNFLDDLFAELKELAQQNPKLWSDRERILGITGSYEQAEWMIQEMRSRYRVGELDKMQPLRRDADNRVHWYPGTKRGEFEKVAELLIQLLMGPLGALERSHNSLNDDKKAAFGAILFIKRPMPVPHDWVEVVQELSSWAFQQFEPNQLIYDYPSLQTQGDYFARAAWIELMNLTSKTIGFSNLTPKERWTLCANQAVSIWQVIGRGVRGNVPIIVHWLDKSFAPHSADNKQDDEHSSLLVAIIKTLEFWMSSEIPWEATIARELWGIFLCLLKDTDFLKYDKQKQLVSNQAD